MKITFKDSREVWRRRGRPQKEIPEDVQELADKTYRTGQACVVQVDPDDEEEVSELVKLLYLYARRRDRKMKVRRVDSQLLFQMVDKPSGR